VLRYRLHADMSRVSVVAESPATPGRAAGLWKHTCFEAFIQPPGSRGYYELNFSPAKQWAVYCFDSYREGMTPVQLARVSEISVERQLDCLSLDATVSLPIDWSAGSATRRAKMALAAVVEEENGRLCYWAAHHGPGKPDFHHADAFALEL
jgi:hypothetical protein